MSRGAPGLAGALAALSALSTAAGIVAWRLPTTSVAAPLARILDAYAPHLIALGVLLAILTLAAGARRIGALLSVLAIAAGGAVGNGYIAVTRPVEEGATTDLRVLFFNVQDEDTPDPEKANRIVAEAIGTGADILIFAEAPALAPALDRLRAEFDNVSPCPDDACEVLVATNLDVIRFWRLELNTAFPPRFAVLEIDVPGHGPVYVAASHLVKPWFTGIAEPERDQLAAQMDWLRDPVVIFGDFNMPPWSGPMRDLLAETGFRAPRGAPATWPAEGGPLALPIDHVLVRDGAAVTRVATFGAGLGSNHLGVLADIAILRSRE
jgi:endonuclease/exonuclease/phosphatase (EEP) superfamily protein YafD